MIEMGRLQRYLREALPRPADLPQKVEQAERIGPARDAHHNLSLLRQELVLFNIGNYPLKHARTLSLTDRFLTHYIANRRGMNLFPGVLPEVYAWLVTHLVRHQPRIHFWQNTDLRLRVFDMPVGENVVEREVIDQHQQGCDCFSDDGLCMGKGT